MKCLPAVMLIAITILSCAREGKIRDAKEVRAEMAPPPENQAMYEDAMMAGNTGSTQMGSIPKQEVNKKKIIRDGRMGIKVADLPKSKQQIDVLLKNNAGYYDNENLTNNDYESVYSLKIRIPADHFDPFISGLESGIGEITFKEISARDVTDQFIDLETRLANKKNYLLRYNDLLKQAKKISEILEIETKIRELEEEIESTVGRLKYLGDQVEYSTLDLTVSQHKAYKYNPVQREKFMERIKQSFSGGWFGLVDFFIFLIKIWPLWIFVAIGYWFWRKRKRRKPANTGR
jgi:hypothetical protein